MEQNLRREQRKWGQMVKFFGGEGEDRGIVGRFYVAVVKLVLLFGSEMWIMLPRLDKALEGLHHR